MEEEEEKAERQETGKAGKGSGRWLELITVQVWREGSGRQPEPSFIGYPTEVTWRLEQPSDSRLTCRLDAPVWHRPHSAT